MGNKKILVRDYSREDYNEVNKLWETTGVGGAHRGDNETIIEETLKDGGKLIILEDIESKQIIGTSWLTNNGRRIYLHHFCVRPDFRRKGLGKLLTKEQ